MTTAKQESCANERMARALEQLRAAGATEGELAYMLGSLPGERHGGRQTIVTVEADVTCAATPEQAVDRIPTYDEFSTAVEADLDRHLEEYPRQGDLWPTAIRGTLYDAVTKNLIEWSDEWDTTGGDYELGDPLAEGVTYEELNFRVSDPTRDMMRRISSIPSESRKRGYID